MTDKLLTIQDISCYGQCSLTVALPIISAMGVECAVLPTAVLSTHTAGFKGYTCRDLSQDFNSVIEHWKKEQISFNTIYTGYLCGKEQIELVKNVINAVAKDNCKIVIDPVMADNGKFYPGFDEEFAKSMATLCSHADVIIPNITEACFLTDMPYQESGYDKQYIEDLLLALSALGASKVVLTGVSYQPDKIGVAVYDGTTGDIFYYFRNKIPHNFHGTGDIYSSTLAGALTRGMSIEESASLAVDFTVKAMELSYNERLEHWYGVQFERAIPFLCERTKD